MEVSSAHPFRSADAIRLYGVEHWGAGYLAVSEEGNLLVTPGGDPARSIDVYRTVDGLSRKGCPAPLVLRFPQLLETQVERLAVAFSGAIEEFHYPEGFRPVFPIKVNQHRPVLEGLLRAGWRHGLGLEVGSRPELMAAMAMEAPPGSLLICNGFKDRGYLELAGTAARLGRRVVVVIEKPFEVDPMVELASREGARPALGLRIRLESRGSGLWEKSGGFASKFGLTTLQLVRTLEKLSAAGLGRDLVLLHFHIGSQITEIRRIKNAVREAARIYAKVRKMGANVRYLDVGGGLGVDYDGSRTSSDSSVNYAVKEYANDVVYTVKEVCDQEHVPHPVLVTESGRWLAAYHALLVVEAVDAVNGEREAPLPVTGREPQVVQDLVEVARLISVKNYREYYHDAVEYRGQMYSLFSLGMLNLEDRAKGEHLFRDIAAKAVRFAGTARFMAEEFVQLRDKLREKYVCNFSVFQSLPDHWALDQLFPVLPVHRLNEPPLRRATLADITCDSDGEVDKFVDLKDVKHALEVHDVKRGEPYYLAFALVGAYQDTMGDLHNLFGRVNEAEVLLDPEGRTIVRAVRRGDRAADALRWCGFGREELLEAMTAAVRRAVESCGLDEEESRGILESYRRSLAGSTYLE